MVEIAISLAVVAFALVAIIGVLPTGMTVQKDNREDTLIIQEGRYWMEAIKSGAEGAMDLTNYVEQIKVETTPSSGAFTTFTIDNTVAPYLPASNIISLLSLTKFEQNGQTRVTNRITARVRSITGPATEQSLVTLTNQTTFRYQLQVEITPARPMPEGFVGAVLANDPNQFPMLQFNEAMGANLWEVRLVLRWPVVERGNDWFVGNGRKTFRARVSGDLLLVTNLNARIDRDILRRFAPNQFNVAIVQP